MKTAPNREIRRVSTDAQPLTLRSDDGKKMPTIVGYAAVFDSPSIDLGGFRESIRKGAFSKSLPDADVRALVDHNPSLIIGRAKAGTLRLSEDAVGLRVEIDLPDNTVGRDVAESLRRGDLDGMSFGFITVSDEWETKDGLSTRQLIQVHLLDVSVVAYPAYPDTSVALRSMPAPATTPQPAKPALSFAAFDAWLADAEASTT